MLAVLASVAQERAKLCARVLWNTWGALEIEHSLQKFYWVTQMITCNKLNYKQDNLEILFVSVMNSYII